MQRRNVVLLALLALAHHVPRVRSFQSLKNIRRQTVSVGGSATTTTTTSTTTGFHPIPSLSVANNDADLHRPNYHLLEDSTRLLLNSTAIGAWDFSHFREAKEIMELWSLRSSKRCALTTERILRRVVEEQIAGNPYAEGLEMADLYTSVIEGWANSGEDGAPERSEDILDHMQHVYEEGDTEEAFQFQPGVRAFNGVLLAYARASRPDAPQQAIRVLSKIYDWYTTGRTDVLPNQETYATVLHAFAKSGKPDAPKVVRNLITHMEKLSEIYASVKPDYNCYNAYIAALLDSLHRRHLSAPIIARLANDCLDEMASNPDPNVQPDTWTFNMVLSAWSKSGEVETVVRAESLVKQLESYYETSGHLEKMQPNSNTYNCLIACYGRSRLNSKATRAHDVLRKMHTLANTGVNPEARPDTVTYNSVMNAYAKTRKPSAPLTVEDLLREMDELYRLTGDRRTKPNSRSYNTCLDAWAKSGQPGSAERILEWIGQMKSLESDQKNNLTNKWTYNAYLQALSKSGDRNMGEKGERVLEEMEKSFQKGNHGLKPDVMTYTNVIHCIALSGRDDALERALAFLNQMEDLHSHGAGDIRPNLFTYNCVINAAAKSKKLGKASLALKILRRMESVALRPSTPSFNNVINACAFSSQRDDPVKILEIARTALREAQEGPGANWISYQTALRVVCTFEQDETRRWHLTRDIFRQCCEDGQLTRTVMTQVKFAVSTAEFAFLRDEASEERTGRFRDDCTINARRTKMTPATKKIVL